MRDWWAKNRILWPLLAGLMIFLGERVFPDQSAGMILTGLGVVGLLAVLGWELAAPRLGWAGKSVPPGLWGLWPRAAFLLALGFYLAGKTQAGAPDGILDWAALFGWGWALSLLIATPVFVLVELAWRAQRNNPEPDPARIVRAAHAGAFLGLLLALVVTLNFVFNRLGWESDLTYFKISEPSAATLDLLAGVERPVEAALFFASGNPVQPLVRRYFQALSEKGGKVSVREFDADVHPREAREYKVKGNGNVVLKSGNALEQWNIGLTLDRARNKLKSLDQDTITTLLKVTREEKTAYFTVGHGEFNEKGADTSEVGYRYNRFQNLLKDSNFKVKPLGLSEGLADKVPDDAGLVILLGPKRGFLPGEVAALKSYVEGGGRLMVFLESSLPTPQGAPEREPDGQGLRGWLGGYGIVHSQTVLANDRIFARRTYTRADHALLVTIGFQNHESTQELRRNSKENAMLLLGSGQFERSRAPDGFRLSPILKGMQGTWGDENGNFVFDEGKEKRDEPLLVQGLSALGEKSGPRILAFADADLALDFLMQNRANQEFLYGVISWLVADGRPTGLGQSEEDRKIIHADADQVVWFYLPVFGVPALVLVLGVVMSARSTRRRKEG